MSDFLDLAGMSDFKGDSRDGSERTPVDLRWDPTQYLKFSGPRLQPALDLLSRIEGIDATTIVDLGCGTGEITRMLADRWPAARVIGIDSSAAMLAKASAAADVNPRVEWVEADAATWTPDEPLDLVYSNAALHWVADHQAQFSRLAGFVTERGALAVQMPKSWGQPSHRLMREVLAGEALGDDTLRLRMTSRPTLEPGDYLDLLAAEGRRVDVWETEYIHVLEGADPVLEWVTSTGLRPILKALGGDDLERFLAEYQNRLREAYPKRPDGTTIFPFRRIFILAQPEG